MWKEGAEESAQRDGHMRKTQQARVALKVEEGPVNPPHFLEKRWHLQKLEEARKHARQDPPDGCGPADTHL